jgi:hypothetical protein
MPRQKRGQLDRSPVSSTKDFERGRKARERVSAGAYPLTRREKRKRVRARAGLPPLPGQIWARFDALTAMAGVGETMIRKWADAKLIRDWKPSVNLRLGHVDDCRQLVEELAATDADKRKTPPVKPGSRPRGRPRKPIEEAQGPEGDDGQG